ncbi:hypothetical protein PTSG_11981 [Salpingoeca rosetta]|uniref:Uncharacterized protein n=1 Tax=Salpingoeca rosetta (strain ATCC 50818 / BSB-021) TaxID=946362 RepID=F2U4L9_SALR5|nr:uncharacterized protein PTSG_11981 [Salpingoeca rosetta]EGD82585.1 hypothetical protein PTSG_11981 [Salpingoeca rosetta]|eukprot:XP_004995821.1 hypothetical protein PTSG_11981 [Salpingoeca rosetta]
MKVFAFAAVVCAALVAVALCPMGAEATYGVDVSQQTYENAWSKPEIQQGQLWCHSLLYVDGPPGPQLPAHHLQCLGWGHGNVDIYFFPCPTCGNPAGQIDAMVANLPKYKIKPGNANPGTYGMLWLEIEGPEYWTRNRRQTQLLYRPRLQARPREPPRGLHQAKQCRGESQWSPIMGDWSGGSAFPLWYAHYDGSASFSDFRAFGGWSKPSIKQFAGDVSMCGAGVDKNWYP